MKMILIICVIAIFIAIKKSGSNRQTTADKIKLDKGTSGEAAVAVILASKLPKGYRVINDLMVKYANDSYAQIDHVVICKHGIFSIETKNYRGIITGLPTDYNWLQETKSSRHSFYNPIKQNNTHCLVLKQLISHISSEREIINIVTFPEESCIVNVCDNRVTYNNMLAGKITEIKGDIYSENEIDEIYNYLKSKNILSKKEREIQIKKAKDSRKSQLDLFLDDLK